MRKPLLIAGVVVMLAGLAAAQVPTGIPTAGNVFVGYSYYNTDLTSLGRNGFNGFEGSIEGKIIPWIGMVADFSANYGSQKVPIAVGTCAIGVVCGPASANAHVDNLLFGPRVSVSVGKFRPFAQGMIGFGHVSTNGFSNDTSLASSVGGGLDYHLLPLVAWRFQGDYIHTHLFNIVQNNVRVSTGIVIRF